MDKLSKAVDDLMESRKLLTTMWDEIAKEVQGLNIWPMLKNRLPFEFTVRHWLWGKCSLRIASTGGSVWFDYKRDSWYTKELWGAVAYDEFPKWLTKKKIFRVIRSRVAKLIKHVSNKKEETVKRVKRLGGLSEMKE